MENKYIKIPRHVFFFPMGKYLHHIDIKSEVFIDKVATCDPTVFATLRVLAVHGAYHILIPLNELMSMTLSQQQLDWWTDGMKQLPGAQCIEQIAKRFHSIMFSEEYIQCTVNGIFPPANISRIIWDCYPQDLKNNLQRNQPMNLCVLIPGLFAAEIPADYFKNLERYMFPQLIQAVEALDNGVTVNRTEYAIVKYAILLYSSELGFIYYNAAHQMGTDTLRDNWTHFSNIRYQEYRKKLEQKIVRSGHIAFYLTPAWVELIDCLCRYIDKYQIDDGASKLLKLCLPILMQCVDRNQDASVRLLEILRNTSISECSNPVILLGIYRALCVETEEYQERFRASLSNIVSNTGYMTIAAEVVSDIVKFYTRYTKELQMRFDLQGSEKLLTSASDEDVLFYTRYHALCRTSSLRLIKNVKWLSDHLFANDQIVSIFQSLLDRVRDESIPYSSRLDAVFNTFYIFGLLTGRLGTNAPVRVYLHQCLEFLQMPELYAAAKNECEFEVLNPYSNSQLRELNNLQRRLNEVCNNLPYPSAVRTYEHNKPHDKNKALFEILLAQYSDILQKQQDMNTHIARLEIDNKATKSEIQVLLSVLVGENPTRNQIVTVLAENQELALELSDNVHQLLKNHDDLNTDHIQILQTLKVSIETAICDDKGLTKEKRKAYFAEALDALCALLPGLDKISAANQLIKAVKKIVESSDFSG